MRLPTFAEIADPSRAPRSIRETLAAIDPDAPHAANLYRVNWFNAIDRRGVATAPVHVEIPGALSGVPARIVVVLGAPFPMIGAHKVLAAYACLAPRLVSGRFDPTRQRAVWPSTGNYCRGGVAISRILGCRGVAVLPAGMSAERFEWLERWVASPQDIVRTPGTESNVKEIYDRCAELARDPANEIVNQFSEFGNYLGHWRCTGPALGAVFESLAEGAPGARLAGFVAASGSSGTLGAGDYLKAKYGTRIAAVEAVECPTLLNNGYGEHNIQGIGDKHVPLIHNVMNTDFVIGVSDRATDGLNAALQHRRPGAPISRGARGCRRSCSGCCAGSGCPASATSRRDQARAARRSRRRRRGGDGRDRRRRALRERAAPVPRAARRGRQAHRGMAAELYGRHLAGADTEHVLEATPREREPDLQPVVLHLGRAAGDRRSRISSGGSRQAFWRGLHDLVPQWDEMIAAFNHDTGCA